MIWGASAGAALVEMTRVVHAPRAHVFAAWRRPERMARWYSAGHAGGNAEPLGGNAFRIGATVVELREVRPPDRLAFGWGSGDPETETLVTVTFSELDGGTRLAIRQDALPRPDSGLRSGLDRLAVLLRVRALG